MGFRAGNLGKARGKREETRQGKSRILARTVQVPVQEEDSEEVKLEKLGASGEVR